MIILQNVKHCGGERERAHVSKVTCSRVFTRVSMATWRRDREGWSRREKNGSLTCQRWRQRRSATSAWDGGGVVADIDESA